MSTLERRTPLKPGKPLSRSGPMRRTPAVRDSRRRSSLERPTLATARPVTGPNAWARAQVDARDKGRCVRCGGPATNVHHRKNRGMGGRRSAAARAAINALGSLLSFCGSGTTGCHGWVTEHPAEAKLRGFVIPTNTDIDPATVPVGAHDGWHLYDNDGGRTRVAPPGIAP